MRKLIGFAVALAAVSVAAAAGSARTAHATYPGAVGRLAFAMNVGGNIDVYSVLANGHDLRRLTVDPIGRAHV